MLLASHLLCLRRACPILLASPWPRARSRLQVAWSERACRIVVACGACAEAGSGQAQLEAKAAAFLALAARLSFTQAVLFCARQHEAAWLAQRLCDAGFPAAYLSGARLGRAPEPEQRMRPPHLQQAVSTDCLAGTAPMRSWP